MDDSHLDGQARSSSWVTDLVEGTALGPYEIRSPLGTRGRNGAFIAQKIKAGRANVLDLVRHRNGSVPVISHQHR